MKNNFEIRSDVAAIFLNREDGNVLETIISIEDLGKAQEFCGKWYASFNKDTNSYYVRGNKLESGKWHTIRLHRFITDAPDNLEVDHINHNTLDNRKINLRIVTGEINKQNQSMYKNNMSGYKGVSWSKYNKKWVATAMINGKQKHLGYFIDAKQAADASRKARLENMPGYIDERSLRN